MIKYNVFVIFLLAKIWNFIFLLHLCLFQCTLELPTPINFLLLNENIKYGNALSKLENKE